MAPSAPNGYTHWFCLQIPRSRVWREQTLALGEAGKGVLGETWNWAVILRGRGGSGFPPSYSEFFPLLQFVRSGVGGILTSPSCLVEGVRSGSRRRNAATASPLARGGAEPESRRAAPTATDTALCSRYTGDARAQCGKPGKPGSAPARSVGQYLSSSTSRNDYIGEHRPVVRDTVAAEDMLMMLSRSEASPASALARWQAVRTGTY